MLEHFQSFVLLPQISLPKVLAPDQQSMRTKHQFKTPINPTTGMKRKSQVVSR